MSSGIHYWIVKRLEWTLTPTVGKRKKATLIRLELLFPVLLHLSDCTRPCSLEGVISGSSQFPEAFSSCEVTSPRSVPQNPSESLSSSVLKTPSEELQTAFGFDSFLLAKKSGPLFSNFGETQKELHETQNSPRNIKLRL